MVVATYNVHRCVGTDGRRDVERVGAVIRELDADVVGLQEVEAPLGSDADQLAQLARSSGLHAAVAGVPGDQLDARLCRTSPERTRVLDLSVAGREPRAALEADLDVGGYPCRVVVTHLGLRTGERRDQLRSLLLRIDDLPGDTLTIILGDLNEWWRPLRSLVGHHGFGGFRRSGRSWLSTTCWSDRPGQWRRRRRTIPRSRALRRIICPSERSWPLSDVTGETRR